MIDRVLNDRDESRENNREAAKNGEGPIAWEEIKKCEQIHQLIRRLMVKGCM